MSKNINQELAGLVPIKSTGAPRHLNNEQEAEIVNIITTETPDEVGLTARKNWYSKIIRQLVLNLYGVSFCQRGNA